jgi:mannose-6-phosphate isomerase-like protein (cupin superfamily)
LEKINLREKLSQIDDYWNPRVVGELNGQHVRLARFKGEFDWHRHENEDEMFLVIEGSFDMQFRDRTVTVGEGEFIIVPRGTEHCPRAGGEAHVLLFEPASTINTGATDSDRTVRNPENIWLWPGK